MALGIFGKFRAAKRADSSSNFFINDPALLRRIIDQLPMPVWVKNANSQFVLSNDEHCQLVNKPESELLGQTVGDMLGRDRGEKARAKDLVLLQDGEETSSEAHEKYSDGIQRSILIKKSRITDGQGSQYILGVNIDLTELRGHEARLQAITESVPAGIVQLDLAGKVLFSNSRAVQMAGGGRIEGLQAWLANLRNKEKDFPGRAGEFEVQYKGQGQSEKTLLVMSGGWASQTGTEGKIASITLVDVSELAALRAQNESGSARLKSIVQKARAGIRRIGTNTNRIAAGSKDLSADAERQTQSLTAMVSAAQVLTDTVKANAARLDEAAQLSKDASKKALEGKTMSDNMANAMEQIVGSSKEITAVVDLVREIAFQTNLLALNAAVEAARAGDAGKGFEVVASEVRALSQRTSQALKSILVHIKDSDEAVSTGAGVLESMKEKLSAINQSTDETARIVASAAGATKEQAKAVDAVSGGSLILQRNAKSAAELANGLNLAIGSVDASIEELAAAVHEGQEAGSEAA